MEINYFFLFFYSCLLKKNNQDLVKKDQLFTPKRVGFEKKRSSLFFSKLSLFTSNINSFFE